MPKGMPNLRELLEQAQDLGCLLTKKGGEVVVSHPSQARKVVVNCRRKDGSWKLLTFVRKIRNTLSRSKP